MFSFTLSFFLLLNAIFAYHLVEKEIESHYD